jgi:hypothetical protein
VEKRRFSRLSRTQGGAKLGNGPPPVTRPAEVQLVPGARDDLEAGRAQHRLDACVVRHPPVRRVAPERALDEGEPRLPRLAQPLALVQREIGGRLDGLFARRGQRLQDDQPVDALGDNVEREQRVAQVVQDAEKSTRSKRRSTRARSYTWSRCSSTRSSRSSRPRAHRAWRR